MDESAKTMVYFEESRDFFSTPAALFLLPKVYTIVLKLKMLSSRPVEKS
jgi:hypothetical protein